MDEYENEKLKVVYCKPGERAEIIEIDHKLHDMQALVGGLIQEFFPFHDDDDPRIDDVALIVNDEGKLNRMPANRAIYYDNGELADVVAGPFFVVYAPVESETFMSLPEDLQEKYRRRFELPEMFFRTEEGIKAVKYESEQAKDMGIGTR